MTNLTARVISIESAQQFTDKTQRVTLKFAEADDMFSEIRVRNLGHWNLEDVVVFETEQEVGLTQ